MMKFACSSFITPGETWPEKFSNLERLGFDGIEIRLIGSPQQQDQQVAEIINLAKTSPVKPCSLVRPTPAFLKELTEDSLFEKIEDVAKTIEYAAALGVPAIVSAGVFVQPKLPSPFLPLPVLDGNKKAVLKTYLFEVGKTAASNEATLLIEPLNRFEGSYYHRLAEAAEILDEVGNPNLGILADVFHINIEEADTGQAILDAKDWIKHVQLGDNNRLLPGQGQFNFMPFFNALNRIGYSGYMAFECIAPMGEFEPLRKSLDFLHGLQIQSGL